MKNWRWLIFGFVCAVGANLSIAEPDFSPAALNRQLTAFGKPEPMGHPRLLKGQLDHLGIVAAAKAERFNGVKALGDYLRRTSIRVADTNHLTAAEGMRSATSLKNWFRQERALEGLAESAFALYVTRDPWFLEELRARATLLSNNLVGRDCKGELSQIRAYAWYFALAYDFAHADLSNVERAQYRETIKSCLSYLIPETLRLVSASPRDGIAFHSLGKAIGASLIVLDDVPEARTWLQLALHTYISNLSPWGGSDGGYANGTSYAHWDTGESLLIWDLIERVLDIPVFQKSWISELPRFVAYTLPPGTPAGIFGDGAEIYRKEEWARYGKALMSRFASPLVRWYERQLFGEDSSRLHMLLSPRPPGTGGPWPADLPNSVSFPSVGWAAMHSAMADRSRVSVYFKSSPFGSLNHSHADQNSFVIHARGKVLAMDSGYYDYYNSPHWRDWYKQTKAHNAITYNGGIGQKLGPQGVGTSSFAGKIKKFVTTDTYDLVIGEAAGAYGDGVSTAARMLVFLKPSTVVVIDHLVSTSPLKWEWNIHTPDSLVTEGGELKLKLNEAEMCINVSAPESLSNAKVSGYAPAPQLSGSIAEHFWHRFSYASPKNTGYFVAVLRMDCSTSAGSVTFPAGKPLVHVENFEISLSGNPVLIR